MQLVRHFFRSTFAVLHLLEDVLYLLMVEISAYFFFKFFSNRFKCVCLHCAFCSHKSDHKAGDWFWTGKRGWKSRCIIAKWILLCKVRWEQGCLRGNNVSFQFTDPLISIHFKPLLYFFREKKAIFYHLCCPNLWLWTKSAWITRRHGHSPRF